MTSGQPLKIVQRHMAHPVYSYSWEGSLYSTLGGFHATFIHGAKNTLGDLTQNHKDAGMNRISPLVHAISSSK